VGGCRRRGRRLGLGNWCSRGGLGCPGLGVSASGGNTTGYGQAWGRS